jgi:uncharacterized protein (DUF952 family)
MQNIIFHVTTKDWWETQKDNVYYKSPSLEEEGFIHLCSKSQLNGVLERYYSDIPNLLLLHIDNELLEHTIIMEQSTNDDYYPHLYGPINMNSILKIEEIQSS